MQGTEIFAAGSLNAQPQALAALPIRAFSNSTFCMFHSGSPNGTRRMNDSLAGAYVADPQKPMLPLDAAVTGVRFEVLEGDRDPALPRDRRVRAEFRCVEWDPFVHATETDGFAAVRCLTRLCRPYWADMPWIAGERWPLREISGWTSLRVANRSRIACSRATAHLQ